MLKKAKKTIISTPTCSPEKPLYMRELDNIYLLTFNNNKQTKQREEMNNLPKLVIALFGISALLDIAEKIKNWVDDKDEKEEEKKEDEPSGV